MRRASDGGSSITVDDVAHHAGVSKTTAASILRNAAGFRVRDTTRHRVENAARALGYRRNALAAALSSGQTHTLGVLLPLHHLRSTSPCYRTYGQDVFVAVFHAACRAGLRVTSIPPLCEEDRLPAVRDLADRRVDGLILASLREPGFVREVYASGIACVEIGSGYGPRLVHPDNEGGAGLAVGHLVELGHRRIVHWRGPAGDEYYAADRRAAGFRAAADRHGLAPEHTPIVSGERELAALLQAPPGARPTAVFAFSDVQALLAIDLARQAGLSVPGDVSLVGFDDNVVAETARPQLTTIHNPLDEQAGAAVALLQALWRNEIDPPVPPAVPTRLVVRQSTAPRRE